MIIFFHTIFTGSFPTKSNFYSNLKPQEELFVSLDLSSFPEKLPWGPLWPTAELCYSWFLWLLHREKKWELKLASITRFNIAILCNAPQMSFPSRASPNPGNVFIIYNIFQQKLRSLICQNSVCALLKAWL